MAELQQPDIVGNYLSRYNNARQQQMVEQDQAFQRERMQQQDGRADIVAKLQMMEGVVKTLGSAQDEAGLNSAKQQWVAMGLPAEAVAAYTAADIPMLREKAGVQFEALKGELLREQINAQRANIRQSNAAAAASDRANRGGPGGGIDPEKESSFRKEFVGNTKDFVSVRDAYGRIVASAEDPSAAGDLALIFNYMKVLDPGSTVREGEFATAQNATGVPARIVNMYNSVISGERLNDDQRKDFVGRAGKLYERQLESFQGTRNTYRGIAEQYGYDPDRTTPDLSLGVRGVAPEPTTFVRGGAFGLGEPGAAPAPARQPAPPATPQQPGAIIRYDAQGNRVR